MSPQHAPDPIKHLRELIDQGHDNGDADANAASLATADSVTVRPSVRTVYLEVTDDDIVFFINSKSGKGQQLSWNPYAAVCFFWRYLQKQAVLEGSVETLADEEADALWESRPRESRLASWASRQHAPEGDKGGLDARVHEQKQRFSFARVSRPPHWVGYRLQPDRFEFWDTGWGRMRMRHLYERQLDGRWESRSQEP